ncbi:MAG: hypothetical protein H6Q70_3894 [Firmicutes bacterium]|nr:hypothetical protein [Bacillota bacterium]
MFCSKCGNKLNHEKKSCDTCGNQVDDINEKSKLAAYVDDVVGKAIKGSFKGIETGNRGITSLILYGFIIVVLFYIIFYKTNNIK